MTRNSFLRQLQSYLHSRLRLEENQADNEVILHNLREGSSFRGTNLWVLVIAVFMASVGLNVNSTAVIIGAMLISPLMGPIMGIGASVAVNDFNWLKLSSRNLAIASLFSIATSTLYFLITPLQETNSELLARTYPSTWDVLIAFLGGLAGIVAFTRKGSSTVIPGVAIATALMPPLCTTGHGIAEANSSIVLGALYLFFINGVFISMATFLFIRFIRIPVVHFVNRSVENRMKRLILLVVTVTLLPSVYLAFNIVQRTNFEKHARNFVEEVVFSENFIVVSYRVQPESRNIVLNIFGESIDTAAVHKLESRLTDYRIPQSALVWKFVGSIPTMNQAATGTESLEGLVKNNEAVIKILEQRVAELEQKPNPFQDYSTDADKLLKEVSILNPEVQSLSIGHSVLYDQAASTNDTTATVVLRTGRMLSSADRLLLQKWLRQRLSDSSAMVVFE